MPASGPVTDSKQFPAATLDDQEAIADGTLGEATVIGPPPFSSPDPMTDAKRMLPLEDGTSAHQTRLDIEAGRGTKDAADMNAADFKEQVEAASTQEELDEIASLYDNSGKEYSTVVAAIEKKQAELDDQDNS